MNDRQHASIVRFVRETLGCRCPDDVFDSITLATENADTVGCFSRLVIGRRLLIYIARPADAAAVAAAVVALAHRGHRDRDTSGLDRFRLVWPAQDESAARDAATAFAAAGGNDDQMFLHVLPSHELPDLGAPPSDTLKP
jgi:hypothetical protein